MAVIPMFPLSSVLLPGQVLPLQIFEDRYLVMLRHCMAMASPGFGVVLIERGSEVGGGDVRADVAVGARIADITPLPNRRFAVILVGTGRLRIVQWLADDPYPLADVEPWPDRPIVDAVAFARLVAMTTERVRASRRLVSSLRPHGEPIDPIVADDRVIASYQLAGWAPIGPADRFRLLCAPDPATRLTLLGDILDDVDAAARFQLG